MIKITMNNADGDAILARIAALNAAELEANCEPTGYQVIISVYPPINAEAVIKIASTTINLGEATIRFS